MLKRIIASTVMAITTQATRAGRSQRARRVAPGDGVLILPIPPPCSVVPSVTTLLYSTTVSQALRQTLRGKGLNNIDLHQRPTGTWCPEDVEGDTSHLTSLSIDGEHPSDTLSERRDWLLRAFATPSNGGYLGCWE